jgi:DNA-directed RNA polymerase specialized sigma24 family protein
MQDPSTMDELFERYTRREISKKEFEGLIFQFVLENYQRFHLFDWNKDKCTEYLCWLYPRLSRAIDSYKNTGASFDAYISAMIHWSAREYRTRETDHRITEYACWKAKAEEMAVSSPEPEYPERRAPIPLVPNPRQVLVLLLKTYFYLSEDFLSRAAPALGMSKEKLRNLVEELRKLRLRRDEEIRGLRERIHCQYYRCIAFEKRMESVSEDSAHHIKMKEKLIRARARLRTMKARLASIRMEATNRQIAEVLGVPKGTVDSNLHALKRKFAEYPGDGPACPEGDPGLS